MDGMECVETKIPAVLDVLASENGKTVASAPSARVEVLAPSVRFPAENAFSACGLRGAPFQRLRLAVLIDGDNQPAAAVENFLKKLPAYGNVTMGRVFGNWSKPAFEAWSDFCRRTGFSARQQHDYVKGKNATDIALVIDAMELTFARNVEGFVLITADSDFTPLAVRLRELGFVVIGAGRAAAASLVAACTQYHRLDEEQARKVCAERPGLVRAAVTDQSSISSSLPETVPSQAWCQGRAKEIAARLSGRYWIPAKTLVEASAELRRHVYHLMLGELWGHCRFNGWTPLGVAGFYAAVRVRSYPNKWLGVKKSVQFLERHSDLYEVSGRFYRLRSAWYDLSPLKDFPFVLPQRPMEEKRAETAIAPSLPTVCAAVPGPCVKTPESVVVQATLFEFPEETLLPTAKTKRSTLRAANPMIEPVLPGLGFEPEVRDTITASLDAV